MTPGRALTLLLIVCAFVVVFWVLWGRLVWEAASGVRP